MKKRKIGLLFLLVLLLGTGECILNLSGCNRLATSPVTTVKSSVVASANSAAVITGQTGVCGADTSLELDLQVACVQQSNQERRWALKIVNNSSSPLTLQGANLAFRVWVFESALRCVVVEGDNGDVFTSAGVRVGPTQLVGNVYSPDVSMPEFDESATHKANQYGTVPLTYQSGVSVIPAGGWIQDLVVGATAGGSCNPSGNWDNFNDDYSGLPNGQTACNGNTSGPYFEDHHFALYVNGVLEQEFLPGGAQDPNSGVAPGGGTCTPTFTPTNTPTPLVLSCGAAPFNDVLPVALMGQQMANWCWATSSAMAISFIGNVIAPPCFSAGTIEPPSGGVANCCANSLCPTSAAEDALPCDHPGMPEGVFAFYKFTYTEVQGIGSIPYSTIQQQIFCTKKPLVFCWWWNGGGGHCLVVKGYQVASDGTQYLWINNPDPECQGEVDFITNDDFNGGPDPAFDHMLGPVDYNLTN
jgi:hypothetical protein